VHQVGNQYIVRIYTEMGRNGVRRTKWGSIWTVPIQMLG